MCISLKTRLAPAVLGEDSVMGQAPAKSSSKLAPNLTGRLSAPPPSSKVRPIFQRDHHRLCRALWSILTKPGLYISWTDWLTQGSFLEGDWCCSTGEGRQCQQRADPCLGSSFPNKATKLLHTQMFPRHSRLLLEHWGKLKGLTRK